MSRLAGRKGADITIRPYADERTILDNVVGGARPSKPPLTVEGAYVTIRNLEVTSSSPARRSDTAGDDGRPIGIDVRAPHTRLIDNIVHDTGDCVGHWVSATDAEISGNLLFFCGWDAPDRGHGHGLYVQNAGGTKDIHDNVIFDTFGYGIHAYTEEGAVDDLHFRRNVVFQSGVLSKVTPEGAADIFVGGHKTALRPVIDGNFTYRERGSNSLGYWAGTDDAVVTNNWFVEGTDGLALLTVGARHLTMTGNHFVGMAAGATRDSSNTVERAPRGVWRFVLPDGNDPRRATIVVYNWDASDVVAVDVSSILHPGAAYELHNVQDYFGDVITGTYDGGPLRLSMLGHSVATPVGWRTPLTTFPRFGVFLLVARPVSTGSTGR